MPVSSITSSYDTANVLLLCWSLHAGFALVQEECFFHMSSLASQAVDLGTGPSYPFVLLNLHLLLQLQQM
jgi:hypothetical protein